MGRLAEIIKSILVIVLAGFALSSCSQIKPNMQGPAVLTTNGYVIGQQSEGIAVYRGIPYAAPPVGPLRWRAPIAPLSWGQPIKADHFGDVCPQPKVGRFGSDLQQSEDCLTLNVWGPLDNRQKLPVMVWIHGGAFRIGAGSQPYYDGMALAKKGVVLVTFNYRLGRLGFFSHPLLLEERSKQYPDELAGNYGLMDQIFLLKWVQKNISQFGGDPGNVTIFGESAGAVSVNYLMTSALSKGLFHKAVSESGGGFQKAMELQPSDAGLPSLSEAGSQWVATSGHHAMTTSDLRNIEAADLLVGTQHLKLGFGPVLDGQLITHTIAEGFEQGNAHKIPFIVGANSFEASLMKAAGISAQQVIDLIGDDIAKIRGVYQETGVLSDHTLAEQLYGDATFVAPARYLAHHHTRHELPTWLYYFDYVPKVRRGKAPGAAHGSEIPFVFGTLSKLKGARLWVQDEDQEVSEVMLSYWTNFAKNSDPNADEAPHWEHFDTVLKSTLLVDENGFRTVAGIHTQRLDLHTQRFVRGIQY